MNLKDLKNLDKEDLLGMLGLEQKSSTGAWLAGTLGTFGIGMLVGAGIALILAPKPGRELREDIRDRLRRAPNDASEAISSAVGRAENLTGVGKTY
ncbi:MAG TPA: YtxH domain-containing protein [Polyangia bacterium]|nr:YtxH domain-containing protein [Polyangia bacterium]